MSFFSPRSRQVLHAQIVRWLKEHVPDIAIEEAPAAFSEESFGIAIRWGSKPIEAAIFPLGGLDEQSLEETALHARLTGDGVGCEWVRDIEQLQRALRRWGIPYERRSIAA
jgi:hypothetical protein